MPPIDPLQLLSALSPLLGPEGGMKSTDEVIKLASLMKKFSKKLVSRCVYIQILKATNTEILQKFLDEGGWEIVNNWLKEGKEKEDYGFLLELLELYKILPMTIDKLKENNSAKIIKALCKVENENMKKLSQEIVDAWMKLVKKERVDHSSDKGKKKRKHHTEKPEPKEKVNSQSSEIEQDGALKAPSNQVVPTKKGTVKTRKVAAEKKPDKLTKTLKRTNADDLEDAKPMIIPVEKPAKKQKKGERPSTVKTYRESFRATGLEDDLSTDKPMIKKGKAGDKQIPILTIKRPLNSDPGLNSPPDKKIKPASLITPADSSKSDINNSSISKAPTASKPKPVHHILQDSAGFMDALVAAPAQPVRKKKKAASKASNDATSPTTPLLPSPSTAENKPQFQFYKDTLESPKEKTPDIKLTGDGERTPSPPGEKEEHDKENKIQEDLSAASNNGNSENGEVTKEIKTTSNLKLSDSKKKKSVTWAEESVLKEVHYFVLDETERVNVNNVKNFGDMKSKELQMEKQALMNARRLKGDYMEEQMIWMPLSPISNIQTFERGANSTEKETQRLRQQGVLQYLFLSKETSSESPQEPDPETSVMNSNTKIIPLEDETNQDAVNDYSNVNFLSNNNFINQDLPPALSNLMMSISKPVQQQNQMPPITTNAMQPQMENEMMSPQHYDQYYDGFQSPGQGPMSNMGEAMPINMQGHGGNMGGPMMRQPMPNMGMAGAPRGFQQRGGMRPPWRGPRGPPRRGMPQRPPRGGGARFTPYIPCRNFMQEGSCQFAEKCRFLHPGINGPPL